LELESLRNYLSNKKGATEELPFGPSALVYKVMGKMFALVGWDESPLRLNVKCDPEHALALRAMHEAVQPGYHMNKEHWNTVILDGSLPNDEIFEMIDHSYELVVQKLKKNHKHIRKMS
jgi:predicted DNA-binding protein (MmcQ/YjbR family)